MNVVAVITNLLLAIAGVIAFLWNMIGLPVGIIWFLIHMFKKGHALDKKKWFWVTFGGLIILIGVFTLYTVFLIIKGLFGIDLLQSSALYNI